MQPQHTNLPIIRKSDDCMRKQKTRQGGEGNEKQETNEENQRNEVNGIYMQTHTQDPQESELQLTATYPADSSERRNRCAGRSLG